MLQLLAATFPKIHSSISVPEEGTMELQNNYSITVNYDENKQRIIATFEIKSICRTKPDSFEVNVQVMGVFSGDELVFEEKKEEIHREAYDMLFPYAQSVIADLTVKAGLPPLMMKKVEIDEADIDVH